MVPPTVASTLVVAMCGKLVVTHGRLMVTHSKMVITCVIGLFDET